MNHIARLGLLGLLFAALAACGSSSSSSALPSTSQHVSVRFVDGSPLLETYANGALQPLGSSAYLQVNGRTVASTFLYGSFTPFVTLNAGTISVVARDNLGYAVGPLKSPALTAGKSYTLIVVGAYPKYSVLAFEEPASSGDAQLSLYEASPSVPRAAFGSFQASSHSNLKQLGSVAYGNVATVALGKSVANLGGWSATASCPTTSTLPAKCLTLAQINSFDKHNVLPFNNATRLSLFLFDAAPSNPYPQKGPLLGALDQ